MNDIDISGMDKAELLVKLFNASKPQGMGFLQPHASEMTIEEARDLLKEQTYFDYVRGRVTKIKLSGDTLNPALYDRDNGQGAAARALGVDDGTNQHK